MPLKIELKPHESVIVGEALITNDGERTRFYIDGNVPILREKFILREKDANTPSRRVYFVVQQLYLSKGDVELQKMYLTFVKDLQNAAPSLIPYIAPINEAVLNGEYYTAIKAAAKLLEKEDVAFGAMLNPEI
ncbi:MAG: flagellar biosynthesis repressor FlbT [Alphaproteobacteria bacterium]|nr:flagellar biosynthesis repressor FlbT [Alphaproteobacteria bacterium]